MVWTTVAVPKHALRTILCIEFHPLQRHVQNKVVAALDTLYLHAPILRTILFPLVQMLSYVQRYGIAF